MKYKLVTLPRDTAKMPTVGIGTGFLLTLQQTAQRYNSPSNFLNYLGNNVSMNLQDIHLL